MVRLRWRKCFEEEGLLRHFPTMRFGTRGPLVISKAAALILAGVEPPCLARLVVCCHTNACFRTCVCHCSAGLLLVAVQGPGLSTAVHSIPTEELIELIDGASSRRPLTLWFIDTHAVAARTLSNLSSGSVFGMPSPGGIVAKRSFSAASDNSSSASPLSSPNSRNSHQSTPIIAGTATAPAAPAANTTDLGVDLVINLLVRAIVCLALAYLLYGAVPLEHQAPLLVVGCFTYFVWTETSVDRIWARKLPQS